MMQQYSRLDVQVSAGSGSYFPEICCQAICTVVTDSMAYSLAGKPAVGLSRPVYSVVAVHGCLVYQMIPSALARPLGLCRVVRA
jgi:hypothetical protein